MSHADMDKIEISIPLDLAWLGHDSGKFVPHISVCICSDRRPRMLRRLLLKLNDQITDGLFTYSIVVVDHDIARSACYVVNKMSASVRVRIRYCVEPRRSIAFARNKAVEQAEGAFVAFIEEDEFPEPDWLLSLYHNLCDYRADGVLGAVKRHFEEVPPAWFQKSRIYARKSNPTGTPVIWSESRTGGVLLKRGIFVCDPMPFRTELRAGEDQDFFLRKIRAGYRFIWSSDTVVNETITPAHWKRQYILRKALEEGAAIALRPNCGRISIARSLVAIPIYTLAAPSMLLAGQQHFMRLMAEISRHSGKLLMRAGFNLLRDENSPE